jgi:hypothetical protein
MNLEEFAVDPELYENGKRVDLSADAYIVVRSAASKRAQEVRERLWKPYRAFRQTPQDIQTRLNALWAAEGLLVKIVGFAVDGAPLDLDLGKEEDRARLGKVLCDKKYVGFVGRVLLIAYEDANYQAQTDSVTEGNSGASPAGSSASGEAPSS